MKQRRSITTIQLITACLLAIQISGCLMNMTDPDAEDSTEDLIIEGPHPILPNSDSTLVTGDTVVVFGDTVISYGTETIAAVRVDGNGDFVPDRIGQQVTVVGVVNSINTTSSAHRWFYSIEDSSGGIAVTKGNEMFGGIVFSFGDRIMVTGVVAQYNGLTELEVSDLAQDVQLINTGNVLTPRCVTLLELSLDPESYESEFVEIQHVIPVDPSMTWPSLNQGASIAITDGTEYSLLFIDQDSDIDGSSTPQWPATLKGVFRQYDASYPYSQGYSISPNYRSDIQPS